MLALKIECGFGKGDSAMDRWLLLIIQQALAAASPRIVASLRGMVQEMVERAVETSNPWDDVVVGLLQTIVGKPGDRVEEPDSG